MQVRSIGKYFNALGSHAAKAHPSVRTSKSAEAVQVWLEGECPGIEQRARGEGAEIHWGDETARVFTDVRGRRYAPAGKTPVAMAVDGTCHKLSMVATVTDQGKTRRMIIDDAFNANKFIELLAALHQRCGQKSVFDTGQLVGPSQQTG